MAEVTIEIQGMTCSGCVRSVTGTLNALPGVDMARVSLDGANATIKYDPDKIDIEAMRQAVEEIGFDTPR